MEAKGPPAAMPRRLDKNILVISDLHLGESINPTAADVSYLRRLATLERELCAFLTHYREHRIGERPWRLVINGDMVDFMSVLIMPKPAGEPFSEEERQYGLGHGEGQSLAKLNAVLARHGEVFDSLARFVRAGNELVIVVGNHDVEFCYPAVRRRLVEALGELGAPADGIRFCPWFYYEEEVVYVEHGHQYDEYCSFDYQLHPVEPRGGVTLSVAHAGVRYFTNLVPEFQRACGEAWGFFDYMRWARAQGARGVARILIVYATLIRKLLEIWSLLTDRAADAERAELHRRRLREMATEYRIAVDQVEALDGLHRLPVLKSLFKLLATFFLDRLLLGILACLALGVVIGATHGMSRCIAIATVLAAAAIVNYVLSRLRVVSSAELLRSAPEAIWRILRAPFIVFGHSHRPESVRLASGATYFNTGTWAPDEGRQTFTHVIITGGDEVHGELCQWRDGVSTPLP